jgi:hypothetical protein
MGPDERLLLVAHPRSGRSNIHEILQMHPALEICDEPFNENRVSWALDNENYRGRVNSWKSLEAVLEEIFRNSNGLKLLSYQLREEWVTRLIERPDFRVLFVRRRNLLQSVVSGLIAEQTGLWHRWDTNQAVESHYIGLEPVDTQTVEAGIRELARELRWLEAAVDRRTDGRTHRLLHEELFFADRGTQSRAIGDLWSFCGVEAIDSDRIDYLLRPERSKLNSAATYRLLPNADEIERACGSDETGHLF